MTQETYNLWSIILSGAGLFISFGVGAVVFWYTLETKRLRMQSESQTAMLQKQVAISYQQAQLFEKQVRASVRPFVMCEIESSALGGNRFSESLLYTVKGNYRGILWNPTDRVAHDLRVLVHDQTGYYWSEEAPVLRKMGEPINWSADGPVNSSMDPLTFGPESVYGHEHVQFQLEFPRLYRNKDFVAVFFCDVNGNVYTYFAFLVEEPKGTYRLRFPQSYKKKRQYLRMR